ncbi:MAG: thioesterase, partial [Nocardia sp.]|nr:thioesterase [Nocardia sp.]
TVDAPIQAMGGSDDEHVTIGDLYGWQQHTTADLRLEMFDGGHFYLHDHIPEIAELLAAELEPVR